MSLRVTVLLGTYLLYNIYITLCLALEYRKLTVRRLMEPMGKFADTGPAQWAAASFYMNIVNFLANECRNLEYVLLNE